MPTLLAIITEDWDSDIAALSLMTDAVRLSPDSICFSTSKPLEETFFELRRSLGEKQFILLRVNGGTCQASEPIRDGLHALLNPKPPQRTVSEPMDLRNKFAHLRRWSESLHDAVKKSLDAMTEILDGEGKLPFNCPSRSSAAAIEFARIEARLVEVKDAVEDVRESLRA